MDREDFFEWMNTCPTDWEVMQDDAKCVWISFDNIEEYEDEEENEQ